MKYARNPSKQELDHVRSILWKYFDHHVADQVLKGVGLRKGECELGWYPWCNSPKTEPENIEAARKEYFDYVGGLGLSISDQKLSDEEMALIYYAGFIYPETGYVPRTGPSERIMKKLEQQEKEFERFRRKQRHH